MLRGQRAQAAKKERTLFCLPQHRETRRSASRSERRTRRRRGAAGNRCSLSPGLVDYTGHGPNRTGYGEYLRLGSQGLRKGAKLAELAEQRIIIPGVGLAVESHGEEGSTSYR
ncbi:hypothetical protein Q8A73_006911 [Channa argus]|nr:hypothetical protein Q8A73_006911 [Channa argus]